MTGIPPARAGRESIDVTMSCDAEGILHVTALCRSTGGTKDITIKSQRTGLTEEEVKDLKVGWMDGIIELDKADNLSTNFVCTCCRKNKEA